MKSILWSEMKRSTIEIHEFRALSHASTCDFANVFLLDHGSSLENSMHPDIPVSFRGGLARTPQPHGRAGIVRAFVEDLPNSNSDVDTTEPSGKTRRRL